LKECDEDDNDEKGKYSACEHCKKLLIHIGDVGGDPMWCVGPSTKGSCGEGTQKKATKGCSRDQ